METQNMETKAMDTVRLKSGKMMHHLRDSNGRHLFFGNLVAMNAWILALLIFILLTSMLVGFYQLQVTTEIGSRVLASLAICSGQTIQTSLVGEQDDGNGDGEIFAPPNGDNAPTMPTLIENPAPTKPSTCVSAVELAEEDLPEGWCYGNNAWFDERGNYIRNETVERVRQRAMALKNARSDSEE